LNSGILGQSVLISGTKNFQPFWGSAFALLFQFLERTVVGGEQLANGEGEAKDQALETLYRAYDPAPTGEPGRWNPYSTYVSRAMYYQERVDTTKLPLGTVHPHGIFIFVSARSACFFATDALELPIHFSGGDLSMFAGQLARIVLHLTRGARLFAFGVK